MKKLNEKLTAIQCGLKVKKTSYNSFGKYYFRNAESILEAVKPFLDEHKVTVAINEEVIPGGEFPMLISTATLSDGENSISAQAVVGVDLNQKGMQMPQKFGSASSYGKKYALGNLFLIDDTADSDATNTHGRGAPATPKAKPKMNADQLAKAKEYIASGKGTVTDIKAKYAITAAQEKELSA